MLLDETKTYYRADEVMQLLRFIQKKIESVTDYDTAASIIDDATEQYPQFNESHPEHDYYYWDNEQKIAVLVNVLKQLISDEEHN